MYCGLVAAGATWHLQRKQPVRDGELQLPGLKATVQVQYDNWGVPHIEAALGKGIVPTETIKAALASKATRFEIDPRTIIEPGRGMVGNAGVIKAEVVLISRKSDNDEHRWVFLDIGKFGGLAETMDEAIRYPIRTVRDADEMAPCVLAGPTCDSADVLYEKNMYPLPISLSIGDEVLIEGTGAYTTTYSAVAFNGFEPLKSYVI